ncbi:NAD-dependent epimerase/dehydratase family protein [Rhodobacter sp. SY28-1]|uniref:NAD-dependent epimerase/dehydratase family protein n=1 Tax=Rhodobacter sp. SY28-1 TaxID=2562317 RepID=UPI0010C051B2|nr:NAD-dependent epimerase/dehydratase family protein [Rhodobacter sp. SY28-1]
MRCVVLGGCGFIGSHVVDRLVGAGHSVRVVSRRPEALRGPVKGVEYRFLDYGNRASFAATIAGADVVFHMISATTPASGDQNPMLDIEGNLAATVGLLDLMEQAGIRRLVYVSSGGVVYGTPQELPIPETHPLRPINSYGIVKVAIESYIDLSARTKGLMPVILRPANVYGTRLGREGHEFLVSRLLRSALLGQPVSIWGDGSIVRDYLHVNDLARLAVLAAESGITGTFNAGSGTGVSVRALIDLVSEVSGRSLVVDYGSPRACDVPVSILDCTRARDVFGWMPEVALREGLAQTWAWHLATRNETTLPGAIPDRASVTASGDHIPSDAL